MLLSVEAIFLRYTWSAPGGSDLAVSACKLFVPGNVRADQPILGSRTLLRPSLKGRRGRMLGHSVCEGIVFGV